MLRQWQEERSKEIRDENRKRTVVSLLVQLPSLQEEAEDKDEEERPYLRAPEEAIIENCTMHAIFERMYAVCPPTTTGPQYCG